MKAKFARRNLPLPEGCVVCGTDFSPPASDASEVAFGIARRLGVPLALVHAVEMPRSIASDKEVVSVLTANRVRVLGQVVARARKTGADVFPHMESGPADEVLVKLAAGTKARLLVVGSLGRRNPEKWLLGSVAERTAERTKTPTLVLRVTKGLQEWVNGERTLKVFVGFNFTMTSEGALRWMNELMAIGPCDVVLGYVNWPVEEHRRIGAMGPLPLGENLPEVLSVLERDMKNRARTLLGGAPVRCRVEAHLGRTEVRLAEMAKEEGADLIVAGSLQYGGIERLRHASVSRGLLSHAKMSVAIVPLASDNGGRCKILPVVRHVLLCTDFSVRASAAIPHGYALLRDGGIVTLLHVLPPSKSAPNDETIREVSHKLSALVPIEASQHGISTQVEVVVHRDAALAICQVAERLAVDVICLCSHGRAGLSKALLGSVAGTVMAKTRRPLFVVRPPPC